MAWTCRTIIRLCNMTHCGTQAVSSISLSNQVTVRSCHSHHNGGPGIWFDGDNRGSVISDNVVEQNTHAGIMYEISLSALITGNTAVGNGTVHKGVYGAGILVLSSSDVEIANNTVTGNSEGILAHQEDRGSGAFGVYEVKNLWVHDNTVTQPVGYSGMLNFMGNNAMLYSLNNRFDNNHYDVRGNATPFYPGSLSGTTIAAWQALGQDVHSTFTGP